MFALIRLNRITPLEAAGAIASSADDMAKWMWMLLNKGVTPEGAMLLNDTRLKEMMSPIISVFPRLSEVNSIWQPKFPVTAHTHSYGYAWLIASYRGRLLHRGLKGEGRREGRQKSTTKKTIAL
jgi:CubicO group peptidase (beta-lactamase class C family)